MRQRIHGRLRQVEDKVSDRAEDEVGDNVTDKAEED